MRNHFPVVLIITFLSGCATAPPEMTRWDHWRILGAGHERADAVALMGQPDEFTKDNGQDILIWHMDRFEKCAVVLKDGIVEGKTCKDDTNARAQWQATGNAMMMQMMMNPRRRPSAPSFRPMQPYQAPRPTQTTCTPGVGGSINCTSQPTGVDTSIYNQ